MTLAGTWLDKVSRITQNPDVWHSGKRLWRFLLKQLYSVGLYKIPDPPVLKNWIDKASLHLRGGEFPTRRLWFLGYVYYDEEYFLRDFLDPGMTVIDVGANIGVISTICGLRVRPTGAVHSFEPLSSTFGFLEKNISTNGLEEIVTANRLAVSNKSGDLVKLDYSDRHSDLTRLSISDSNKRDSFISGYEQVSTVTLDDYVASHNIQTVDFLKIDVEGAELLVLDGAHEVIERHHPTILCEFNQVALDQLGGSTRQLWDKWTGYGYLLFDYNRRAKRLIRCLTAPQGGSPTYIGTPDPERLVHQLGARIV